MIIAKRQKAPTNAATSKQQLWARLLGLRDTHLEVFQNVIDRMSAANRHSLRLTNHVMRKAINDLTREIKLPIDDASGRPAMVALDLGQEYPNATELSLALTRTPVVSVMWLKQQLAEASPKLLGNITKVNLSFTKESASHVTLMETLLKVLSRCSKLQAINARVLPLELSVAGYEEYQFRGKGSTPEERSTSMQQQLAVFAIMSPQALFAPNCLPMYPCLASLEVSSKKAMMRNAIQCRQLQRLVVMGTASQGEAWGTLQPSLSRMQHLTLLTELVAELGIGRTVEASQAWWEAVGNLQSLQRLVVQAVDLTAAAVRVPYSKLTALTSLAVNRGSGVDLSMLDGLTALRHLDVRRAAGSVADLKDLSLLESVCMYGTAAEALGLDGEHAVGVNQLVSRQHGEGDETAAASWDHQLQSLHWRDTDAPATMVVAKLTLLTELSIGFRAEHEPLQAVFAGKLQALQQLQKLEIAGMAVGVDLCWALASLPCLASLSLSDHTVEVAGLSHSLSSLPDEADLPTFRKLQQLHLGSSSRQTVINALQLMMKWTRVSDTAGLRIEGLRFYPIALSTVTTPATWMKVMADSSIQPAALVLVNDDDASMMAGVVSGWRNQALTLNLYEDVSGPALVKMLAAWGGVSLTVNKYICFGPLRVAIGGNKTQVINSCHVQAIANACPQLERLALVGCHSVGDAAICELAKHCTSLVSLSLTSPQQMTDASAWALHRYCHKLSALQLRPYGAVTAAGVQPWLFSGGDKELRLAGTRGLIGLGKSTRALLPAGHVLEVTRHDMEAVDDDYQECESVLVFVKDSPAYYSYFRSSTWLSAFEVQPEMP